MKKIKQRVEVFCDFNNIAFYMPDCSVLPWRNLIQYLLVHFAGYQEINFSFFGAFKKKSEFAQHFARLRRIVENPSLYDINSFDMIISSYFDSTKPKIDADGRVFNRDEEIIKYIESKIGVPDTAFVLLSGDDDFWKIMQEASKMHEISIFAFKQALSSSYDFLNAKVYNINSSELLNAPDGYGQGARGALEKIYKNDEMLTRWESWSRYLFNPPSFYPSRADFLVFSG